MKERYIQIDGVEFEAEQAREGIVRRTQQVLADPNLSETYKNASIEVAEKLLGQIKPEEK
jgi:hypothetical protein